MQIIVENYSKKYQTVLSKGIIDGVVLKSNQLDLIPKIVNVIEQDKGRLIYIIVNNVLHDEQNILKVVEELSIPSNIKLVIALNYSYNNLILCSQLAAKNIAVSITNCVSVIQTILAAKSLAQYVSIPLSVLANACNVGTEILHEVCNVFENYPELSSRIIVSDIYKVKHIVEVAKLGIDIVQIDPSILDNFL